MGPFQAADQPPRRLFQTVTAAPRAGRQPGPAQVRHADVDGVEPRRDLVEFLDEQGVAGDVEPAPRRSVVGGDVRVRLVPPWVILCCPHVGRR
ncbi:hypothetical protein AWC03_17115 [Mycobacterium europaeum]|nr:hypothetical protein [Mycobacterium europaeum]ORV56264.1 hypothetical protein AWC03_17115 [Mycobacterium europaeum]